MQTHWHDTPRGPIFARHWGDPSLPRLLMLHGFPEYSGAWEGLATQLQHRFHCIAPDQRGYGQTGGPDDVGAYTTSNLVQDMAALVGDEPLTVLGHDWGSAVAYGMAMFTPQLVNRLIILNGVHPGPFSREMASGGAQSEASQYINGLRQPGAEDALSANNFERLLQIFSAKMDTSWFTDETQTDYAAEWARPGRLKTMLHWYRALPLQIANPGEPLPAREFPPEQFAVRCPHLLVWGMKDTALLPQSTEGLEAYAPDLTRVEFPDADHWIAHQAPEAVAKTILDWHP